MEKKVKIVETVKEDAKKLIGEVAENQIAVWKKQHKDVFSIEVEGHIGYVRGFDRATMKYALSQLSIKANDKEQTISAEKIINIGEIGLTNCWLGGSDEILTNDRLFIAAAMQVGELFDFAETKLKKL